MAIARDKTLYEEIYSSIDENEFLLELYDELLIAYTRHIFGRAIDKFNQEKTQKLLSFASILSLSNEGRHKIWAQQIVSLLEAIEPKNKTIKDAKYEVLLSCTNYKGLNNQLLSSDDLLKDAADKINFNHFKIPNTDNEHFFAEQKTIYDSFDLDCYSYSAPTSMGKTFIMRVFIKDQIKKGLNKNYAIIVPTKALISEVKKSIIDDMREELTSHDYRIVTAIGDLALTKPHNFIYVMTPERMLHLTNNNQDFTLDYLFIDEAHKISSTDTRSPIYYDLLDRISYLQNKPHIFFSSPNIPNPEVYLKLVKNADLNNKIHVSFSPVSQIKYLIDFKSNGAIYVYNDFNKSFKKIGNNSSRINLNYVLREIGVNKQNLIYCQSIDKTMKYAKDYASTLNYKNNKELDDLSNEIARLIHKDYFLVDIIKKGVAFHVGYLPTSIRSKIEQLYKNNVINTLFCTSTLIEGVNLPADNLLVTSNKAGRSTFDEVSFRNLIGRVGRIKYNLFGNVFLIRTREDTDNLDEKYKKLLDTEIPKQNLSIDSVLKKKDKRDIVSSLVKETYEIPDKVAKTPAWKFDVMRKFQLILKNDIQNNNKSAVLTSFSSFIDEETARKVSNPQLPNNNSTDISPDQYKGLKESIENGLTYPSQPFNYYQVVDFLKTLNRIFKWEIYEKTTLGNRNKNHTLTHIEYYATLLLRWMSGDNLGYIISSAIRYKENNPNTGVWLNNWKVADYYDQYDVQHKNYVIAETLNSLDRVILFKILNYFREFSTEYKKQNNKNSNDRFPNDWYEYVEYGTIDDVIITLQQCGFEREEARYIKDHGFIDYTASSPISKFTVIKDKILNAKNPDIIDQATEVLINCPELFK